MSLTKHQQRAAIAAQMAAYQGQITECPGTDNTSTQRWIEKVKHHNGYDRARKRAIAMKRRNAA